MSTPRAAWNLPGSPASRIAVVALFALITLGEVRLLDRLLYRDASEYGFVLANVKGVLSRHPVSKSWQQRFLGPLLVVALDRGVHDRLTALKLLGALLLAAANAWLFAITLEAGTPPRAWAPLAAVAAFGFVHLLLIYKLEYPWDWIDVLLFLSFGRAAARGSGLLRSWPLLLIGTFNHETILYIPLWYALLGLQRRSLAQSGVACGLLALVSLGIFALRSLYLGRPNLPGQVFETPTPLIENHLHIAHNLEQWFVYDWREGRSFISASLSFAVLWLVWQLLADRRRVAASWSLLLLASIVCFGYVNETRHYLTLIAFWFAYTIAGSTVQPGRADAFGKIRDVR